MLFAYLLRGLRYNSENDKKKETKLKSTRTIRLFTRFFLFPNTGTIHANYVIYLPTLIVVL